MFTSGHDKMRISVVILNLDMLPRGPMDLKFGHTSQRSDGLKFGRASQRSDRFEFGRASQRSIEIEFWTCF